MGQVTVVYGAIVEPHQESIEPLNEAVLNELPDRDEWPFLIRGMFHVNKEHPPYGSYRQRVITIGASYKSVEWEWDEWLEKFEEPLRKMYWEEINIHLRPLECTVGYWDYYKALNSSQRFLHANPPLPVAEWKFEGGPREFKYPS